MLDETGPRRLYYDARTAEYFYECADREPPFIAARPMAVETPPVAPPTLSHVPPPEPMRAIVDIDIHEREGVAPPLSKPTSGLIAFSLAAARATLVPMPEQTSAFLTTATVAASHLLAVGLNYDSLCARVRVDGKPAVIKRNDGTLLCYVSMRKFPDEIALHKHVSRSALYRDKLAGLCDAGRITLTPACE